MVPQGSVLSPLLFLIYVNDLPKPHHRQNSKSQFADDTTLWAASKNVQFAADLLRKDLRKLAKWCAKWRIKLNPEKTKVIIFSRSPARQKFRTHSKTVWWETQNLSSSEISRNHFRLQIHLPKTLWGNPEALQHQVSPNQTVSQQKYGDTACPPYYKSTNNVFGQFLDMVPFRP